MSKTPQTPRPKHWLVRPETIRILWAGGIAVLALTVAAELLASPHPYFGIDGTLGFNAWYGLVTCTAMVIVAKGLGVFLKREDTYHDE